MLKALAGIDRWFSRHELKFVYGLAALAVLLGMLAAGSIAHDMMQPQYISCYSDDCPSTQIPFHP